MTVSTELSHEEYTGNGVTTDFDFRFRIFEAKHLVVSVADQDGTERILTNGTDYTLRGVGSYRGGKVILKMPLATGWKIGIARDLPAVQETDLRNQGKFFAEVHEDAFDYLTMLIQKSMGFLSLCLRKPSFISDHYDAKGNKISNLGKPVKDGDAVNLGTMKDHISAKDKRSLRVADKDIPVLPNAANRANKLLSFDDDGNPVVIVPESGSAADVLAELGKPDGFHLVGGIGFRYVEIAKDTGDSYDDGTIIIAKHGFTVGDYAGGVFRYYKNRDLQDDGGVVINVGVIGQVVRDGVKGGRYPGKLNILWYGAMPDEPQFDNSTPINKALSSQYSNSVYFYGICYIKNQLILNSRKSFSGEVSCWAYSDSGFNLTSTIKLSLNHNIPYGMAVIDARKSTQTNLSYIDIDGSGLDVICIEYGYRVGEINTKDYNNNTIDSCVFRDALIGMRTDHAGLFKVNNTQFTTLKEYGVYSDLSLSDSIFTSCYWNDIGYHGDIQNPNDPYNSLGSAVALGPHSGTSFIGGKVEWCRMGFYCNGSSYVRIIGFWMDVFKQAAIRFTGANRGAGKTNIISGVVITGAGWSTEGSSAIEIYGYNENIDLMFDGVITGSDELLRPLQDSETYGPKLSAIKIIDNKGIVTVNGDLIDCAKKYSIYADGKSKVIDNSTSNLPNVITGSSIRNGYRYDAGSQFRGLILRDIPDHTPQNYGVGIGAMYRVGDGVFIRTK